MITPAAKRRGRPRKFGEDGRPVTVTLPVSVLRRLAEIDPDRSRAIVSLVEGTQAREDTSRRLPELVEVAPGVSIILVGPCECLRAIPWLRLIEVAPVRYLLIIPSGTPVDRLELALIDLLEAGGVSPDEVRTVQHLRALIRTSRSGSELSKAELLLVQKTA